MYFVVKKMIFHSLLAYDIIFHFCYNKNLIWISLYEIKLKTIFKTKRETAENTLHFRRDENRRVKVWFIISRHYRKGLHLNTPNTEYIVSLKWLCISVISRCSERITPSSDFEWKMSQAKCRNKTESTIKWLSIWLLKRTYDLAPFSL